MDDVKALSFAARKGDVETVAYLLQKGISANACDKMVF